MPLLFKELEEISFPTQEWGVLTAKGKNLFAHVLKKVNTDFIFVPYTVGKVKSAKLFSNNMLMFLSSK
jgi:hypothetical protein